MQGIRAKIDAAGSAADPTLGQPAATASSFRHTARFCPSQWPSSSGCCAACRGPLPADGGAPSSARSDAGGAAERLAPHASRRWALADIDAQRGSVDIAAVPAVERAIADGITRTAVAPGRGRVTAAASVHAQLVSVAAVPTLPAVEWIRVEIHAGSRPAHLAPPVRNRHRFATRHAACVSSASPMRTVKKASVPSRPHNACDAPRRTASGRDRRATLTRAVATSNALETARASFAVLLEHREPEPLKLPITPRTFGQV
jgi:hypothetical protein